MIDAGSAISVIMTENLQLQIFIMSQLKSPSRHNLFPPGDSINVNAVSLQLLYGMIQDSSLKASDLQTVLMMISDLKICFRIHLVFLFLQEPRFAHTLQDGISKV